MPPPSQQQAGRHHHPPRRPSRGRWPPRAGREMLTACAQTTQGRLPCPAALCPCPTSLPCPPALPRPLSRPLPRPLAPSPPYRFGRRVKLFVADLVDGDVERASAGAAVGPEHRRQRRWLHHLDVERQHLDPCLALLVVLGAKDVPRAVAVHQQERVPAECDSARCEIAHVNEICSRPAGPCRSLSRT